MTNTHAQTPIDRALELLGEARALVQRLQREQLRQALDAGRRRLQGGIAGVRALDAELATLQAEDAERRRPHNPRPQVEGVTQADIDRGVELAERFGW